ncbi:hypothetical protein Q4F19_19620 [Sphingomonas sp. BIUV-7]|uniref:Uncharacterized protein n=1 Tax=Sphingomonas natans TaxID=3063330 RepID=A0ABT8YE20_9SPHN|nr:hypothetical protein [Sphingomonas sp. BIUV-7]MDO6416602.1 hypothetical protein [Sphingomonas sp. BIUV-7]
MIPVNFSSWSENRATFGGGGKAWSDRAVFLYYFSGVAICCALGVISGRPSEDLLSGLLSAVSIIAGFSFSALMFFVDHEFSVVKEIDSLEQASKQKRIDKLADSVFRMLYYFTIVALALISSCVVALLMPALSSSAPLSVARYFWAPEFFGRSLLYFLMLETATTFLRILRRLRYLFGKVRELQR